MKLLEKDTGLTKTGVVEIAVRDLAKQRSIRLPALAEEHTKELVQVMSPDGKLSDPLQEVIPAHTEADVKRLALIAKLQQWNAEDATHDPEEIARREARWRAIEQNIETNRVSFPVPED